MHNTGGVDISVLEGWLIKEKSQAPKYSFLGDSNKRWFKVQVLRGLEGEELALCYFKDNRSNEPKGWIFTRDITEIHEDKVSITIISPAKTMKVSAQTRAEHKLWAAGIRAICPDADFFALGGELMSPRAESRLKEAASTAAVPSDAKAEDKGMSPPIPTTITAIPEGGGGGGKNTTLRRKSTTKIPPAAQEKEEEPKPIQASEAPRRESLREEDNGMTPRSRNRTDTPYGLDSVRRRAGSNEEDNHLMMGRPNSGNSRRSSRDSRDEDEYERWKEERRLQQTPPNGSSGSNRRSSGKGGDTATSPAISSQQPSPIAGGTMTSRVHQHIRSGSGSSSGTEALQEMDLPSENGGNSRSTAAPREFLKISLEKKREPSPVVAKAPTTPAPVAQAPPKVKRRAADGFDDDDEEDEWGQGGGTRTTKAVSNDERKMPSSSRGLLAAQGSVKDGILASSSHYALRLRDSSDSEDENIDFQAEKVALSPSNVVAEEASAPGKITSEEGRNGGGRAKGDGSLSGRGEGEGRRTSPPERESKASSSSSAGEVGPGPRGATAVSPPSSSQTIGGRRGSRVPAPQGPPPHRALPKTARVNRTPPSSSNSPPSSSTAAASSLHQQQAKAIIRPDENFAEEDWDDDSDGEGVGTIGGRPDGGEGPSMVVVAGGEGKGEETVRRRRRVMKEGEGGRRLMLVSRLMQIGCTMTLIHKNLSHRCIGCFVVRFPFL